MEAIYQKLTEIFREVFDDPGIVINADTTADDIEEWDSMSHINLILMVELKFNIEFSPKEIRGFNNTGEMAKVIQRHLSG